MFPIRDHNPSLRTPYVTYALIVLNSLIFLSYWPLADNPRALAQFFDIWAMIPAEVTQGRAFYTVVSSTFLHAGLLHLFGNMLFLWIFGDNLEDQLGHLGFLVFYLLSGIGAGLAQIVADPVSPIPNVGASGAIAGVMGGYLLLFPQAKVDILIIIVIIFRVIPVPAWMMLLVWFGIQVISGVSSDLSSGGVAYWAHAGGFVVGLALMLPFWLRGGGPEFWRRTQGHPPNPEARYSRSSIPRVPRR